MPKHYDCLNCHTRKNIYSYHGVIFCEKCADEIQKYYTCCVVVIGLFPIKMD